ncbi:MAG TPA: glycosyltransferase family A protein [Polyangiaceae bacterium]|jgi:glycosyltransferase involved in cell wall biosynthesis|nr:glycosyltransferase family A protein [Polyangiaceae bacterium]
MLVSILIPTLNRRALLERAVDSALAQTHQDLEIVVSDDGSTDDTRSYLADLVARESRVRLAPQNPAPGLFTNMNHLLEQRRGDFFCVLADDDRLEPDFVERLLGHLEQRPRCVACFCGMSLVDIDERQFGTQATALRASPGELDDVVRHVIDMQLLLCNVLYRTAALGQLRFDLECLGTAEKDFNLRAYELGPFFYCPDALSIGRAHDGQASRTEREFMWLGQLRTLERHHFSRPGDERLRLRALQQTRVGYASVTARTRPAKCLGMVFSYLTEKPSSWQPRELGSLTLSTLRATLRPPRWYLERLRGALR